MIKNTERFAVRGSVNKLLLPALVLFLLLIATVLWWSVHQPGESLRAIARASDSEAAPKTGTDVRPDGGVACLGHIEPQNGVLRVSAAYLDGRPQRVSELRVKQGNRVRAGQLLAILDGNEQLQTAARV